MHQIARDDDVPGRGWSWSSSSVAVTRNGPFEHRIDELAGAGAGRRPAWTAGDLAREPGGELGPDVVGDRLLDQRVARLPHARGERLVDVGDVAAAIERPRRGERSNRTCFPAPGANGCTSSRSWQVLDRGRQLASQFVGAIEHVELAARSMRAPSTTIVPSARRRPRSGMVSTSPSRGRAGGRHDFGPLPAHRDRRGGRELVVGVDADAAGDMRADRTRPEHEIPLEPLVDPGRRAVRREEAIGALAERPRPAQAERRRRGWWKTSSSSAITSRWS